METLSLPVVDNALKQWPQYTLIILLGAAVGAVVGAYNAEEGFKSLAAWQGLGVGAVGAVLLTFALIQLS